MLVTTGTSPIDIAPAIVRWTTAHPEWRTQIEWGRTVASYALSGGPGENGWLALVDPLLPAEGDEHADEVLGRLDGLAAAAGRLEILISIHYHIRSGEKLLRRYRDRMPVRLWANKTTARRMDDPGALQVIDNAHGPAEIAGVAVAYPIGNPRRTETPLYFPDLKALAFGDTIVTVGGRARIWQQGPHSKAWFREKFLPTLRPLLALDVTTLLITHGEAIVEGGAEQLRAALQAPPWDDRSG